LGFEHERVGDGEGSEAGGNGVVYEGREVGDMRGFSVRGGDSEQGDESVERGNGTRRYDAVERVLSVSGSDGARGRYEC